MTRAAFSLVLGFGLVGGLLATMANAQSFSTSTLNRDGSRTLCGPLGCRTISASSIYGRTSWDNDRFLGTSPTRFRSTNPILPGGCSSTGCGPGRDCNDYRGYPSTTLPRSRSTFNSNRDWEYNSRNSRYNLDRYDLDRYDFDRYDLDRHDSLYRNSNDVRWNSSRDPWNVNRDRWNSNYDRFDWSRRY